MEAGSSSASTSFATGIGTFEINSSIFKYNTSNYMFDNGFQLIETTANYGNREDLIATFRRLLSYNVYDVMIYQQLLTLVSNRKYKADDLDDLMLHLDHEYLQIFLIHFPSAPSFNATNCFNQLLPSQLWIAISKCNNPIEVNGVAIFKHSKIFRVQLTEVIAVGPMVHQMRWYSHYTFPYARNIKSNKDLENNPLVKQVAWRYNISTAQLLMLWAIQRGDTIIPIKTTNGCEMEALNVNIRLMPPDLSYLDILVLRLNNHPN